MIDLTEYGFTEINKTLTFSEYYGHGFRITIFDYIATLSDENKTEIHRQSIVIRTKAIADGTVKFKDLEKWLKQNSIVKQTK